METQHHLWHLVARKLSCEATEHEMEELQLLMDRDEDLNYLFQMLSSMWEQSAGMRSPSEKKMVSEQYGKLMQKLKETQVQSR